MGNITVTADKKSSANNRTTNLSPNVAKLVDVDPRSPTEGIVRTPIILDKSSKKASAGRLPFDSPDFESIDGCITEDDSLHHNGNASSLSESVLPSGANKKGEIIARVRHSLILRKAHDAPSLLVKMRQKQKREHDKKQGLILQSRPVEETRISSPDNVEINKIDGSYTIEH